MTNRSPAGPDRPLAGRERRTPALVAAFGLLAMAILAAFAQFGVVQTLIVPSDAAATTANIAASFGLFAAAVAALFIVAILDVAVAWGMYVLMRPVSRRASLLVGWLRVVYAAVFAAAILNLLAVAQLVAGASAAELESDPLASGVATSAAAFRSVWDLALIAFGLHLVGLGALLFRSPDFPRILGGLVVVAGAGYLIDSVGRMFVPGYTLSISTYAFVGEVLLIAWLFKLAIRWSRSGRDSRAFDEAAGAVSHATVS